MIKSIFAGDVGASGSEMCGLRTGPLADADPQTIFWIRGMTADILYTKICGRGLADPVPMMSICSDKRQGTSETMEWLRERTEHLAIYFF